MVDFGHIEHLMGPETGLLTPKTPKLPSEGLMWTNFGPEYQKSSLWVVITDIRHDRPQVGVFWEYLLSQTGFICSNHVILGDPRRAPKASNQDGQFNLNI